MVEKTTERAANIARGVSQRLFPWSEESLEMDVEEGEEDKDMESKEENLHLKQSNTNEAETMDTA